MATTDSINEHMARLRLKMMQQKLVKERDKQRPDSTDSKNGSNNLKVQQALLRRQSLLDRIRLEQSMSDGRPHSYTGGHVEPSTPVSRPPSRRSLPEQSKRTTRRSKPLALEPLEVPVRVVPEIAEPPVRVIQQPHYITQPSPIIHQLPEPSHKWSKSDYMEMMMMENAQMHQHMMRQMMYTSMQTNNNNSPKFTLPLMPPPPQQVLSLPERRPPSVHHHHYAASQVMEPLRPNINHITHLPPLDIRPPPPPEPSVRTYPAEIEPLRQPKVRERPQPRPITKPTPVPPPPVPVRKHAFPGSRLLRKLRHIFYAAWFIAFLKAEVKKNKKPTDKFLFGIKLKEAVAALHRIYLNPDGKIFPILSDSVEEGALDLSVQDDATARPSTEDDQALQELVYIIENLTYNITEIMPDSGVLGTHKKAAVFELIKNGQQFPNGYFWQIERDNLQFDQSDATKDIGDREAFMLLIGIFISRSLVTTLMMKPLDYGLSTTVLGSVAEKNLRLIATIFIYIVRKSSVPANQSPLPIPFEISKYLYSDQEMRGTYAKLKKTLDYTEGLLRDWGEEYVKRLRAAAPNVT